MAILECGITCTYTHMCTLMQYIDGICRLFMSSAGQEMVSNKDKRKRHFLFKKTCPKAGWFEKINYL